MYNILSFSILTEYYTLVSYFGEFSITKIMLDYTEFLTKNTIKQANFLSLLISRKKKVYNILSFSILTEYYTPKNNRFEFFLRLFFFFQYSKNIYFTSSFRKGTIYKTKNLYEIKPKRFLVYIRFFIFFVMIHF